MRRVVKLGGSLLSRDDLQSTMQAWISQQSIAQTLVIVGGGEIVDAVRRLDERQPLQPEQTHWMCIELLKVTFEYAATMFANWAQIRKQDELSALATSNVDGVQLVAIHSFYGQELVASWSRIADAVPPNWTATSDTLAALLALIVDADELVLLKSCDVPSVGVTELSRLGIVDEAFPEFAKRVNAWRVERLA